ncbi:MAG TPA: serine/threonine-protein kinase, partial [Gemmataceae bacterium]|nr:serine/threonine-protein kinase [Gemmataceae bacterium]
MTFSVASLLVTLREHKLLEGAPEAEIGALQGQFQDARLLAKELIARGWLTPFQVNQVFQGRAADLLLGSYVLLERIGEGGMGQVFKARNWKLGKVVALKVIRKERLSNSNTIRRFHREMEAAAKLDHVNIVRAYDADQIGDTHFFAMEYIEGTDLSKLVRKQGPMPVETACDAIRQAALGLQHALERGLTHRDIKPANLLVSDGVVKILDMGLALLQLDDAEAGTTLTHEGAVMGTPDYMAPEQSLDSHNVDIRADLYSLGCTLCFLLTGRVPFPGGTMTEKLLRHQDEVPPPVESLRPEVSTSVGAVVQKLLAKDPDDRFQTPAELADALNELLVGGGCVNQDTQNAPRANPFARLDETDAVPQPAPARPFPRWGFWALGGGAAALVILLVLLIRQFPKGNWGTPIDTDVPAISVRVEANRPWQDSGIDVQAGTPLAISMRGQWKKRGLGPVPAWGVESLGRDRTIVQDTAPMCLLGRIGNQEPVPFGKLRTWTPTESGRLFLQPNFLDLEETEGSIKVEIKGGKAAKFPASSPAPARIEMAEAAIRKFLERSERPSEDRQKLRADLLQFGQTYWGTYQAARVAAHLIPLASPLDSLDPANIPAPDLAFAGKGDPLLAPPGLAAILDYSGKQEAVRAVAVSADGSRIASGGDDHRVCLWDSATGKRVLILKGHSGRILSLAFSLDGNRLASAALDGTLKVWDVSTGKEIAGFERGKEVQGVAFHPDGKRLAAVGKFAALSASDKQVESVGITLSNQSGEHTSLVFSPDGKRLALARADGTLTIHDSVSGKKTLTLGSHAGQVTGIAFSPDGKRL